MYLIYLITKIKFYHEKQIISDEFDVVANNFVARYYICCSVVIRGFGQRHLFRRSCEMTKCQPTTQSTERRTNDCSSIGLVVSHYLDTVCEGQ